MKYAAVYQASKFGLRGLAGGLKNEGKKVFIVNPKIVDTDFHKDKVCINPLWEKTSLDSIAITIKNIIHGKEKRFEIDL
jgi:short-subunit dehydrogenase